MADIFT